ncbi:PAS domain S-box protein [Pleurocapsa sp. PCC 7319]|uniref:PAS domain S-box protein n=1 Tax=Pleurocapsa sp. PCC 7319 TaxID=118161 RepID=UPI00034C1CF2|nr:PAS domain S-box protein [Pleurocapsa sp. PCC 7319]
MVGDRPNETENNLSAFKESRTVMLVEDCDTDCTLDRRYLTADKRYDYRFIEMETGESALAIYAEERPDLILLDYLLPDLDGLEWLRLWQETYRGNLCPVIVLTGHGDETIAIRCIQLGAADYLNKNEITQARLQLSVTKAFAFDKLQRQNQQLIAQLIARNQELAYSNQVCNREIANREKLELIVDNIPLVVYAKKVENFRSGKMWLINREFCRVFQVTEAEIIGKSDREIFPPATVDHFKVNDLKVINNKQIIVTEERVHHGDGQLQTYLSLKIPLLNDEGEVDSIIGIATNITQEKQAQAQLTRLETRFSSTFEQVAVGMALVGLQGEWLMVNQKLCEIVGYTKAELLQTTFQEITHPEDLAADLNYVRQLLAEEIANYSIEKRYIRKDNSLVWINLTVSLVKNKVGEPEYFISVIEDISDRRNLEVSRQKALQRLSNLHQIDRAIVEARQPKEIAVIAIDSIQQLLTCQRTSIVTFNLEKDTATILLTQGEGKQVGTGLQTPLHLWQELINRLKAPETDYIVAYLEQLPQLSAAIPSLANVGLNCLICFPLRTKDGLLGILKLWIKDLNAVDSEKLTIVKEVSTQVAIALKQAYLSQTIQDYTLELEDKVRERTAQLEEINQELKAFSYSISHDLKAPLRAIQGFAIALQEDYAASLDELGREYTQRLASSAQQMEQLIQDLLTYSRLSRTNIERQSVDLNLVMHKALEELESPITKMQAEITVEPLLRVWGNRIILQQIIINLLSNAIKFVPDNARPQIRIWTEAREGFVRLWIEDNGIGIESQHQGRIFQVFERLHGNESYPGTGIGLAIVKKGVERLGGKYGVESMVNRGSRFWIELPGNNEQ